MKYKFKIKNKKRKFIIAQNESINIIYFYTLLIGKIFFLSIIIFTIIKSYYSSKEKKTELNINTSSQNYTNEFIQFTSQFSNDSSLTSLLNNISIISVDYSNKTKINSDKIKINICISLSNGHIYVALVAMESALSNLNKEKSIYIYHILCSGDVDNNSIEKIKNFMNKYNENLELIFYNMSNIFIQFKHQRLSQVTYYRLLLPLMIPSDRIIYLDNDILVFKDLLELYQTSFNGNYVLGSLDMTSNSLDYLGIKSDRYINAGVLLINLDKIRKDNKHIGIIKMALFHRNLRSHDQTVINYIFYPNIGLLPFKYGLFNFQSESDLENKYMNIIRQKLDIKELIKAFNDPGIMHLLVCHPKVWMRNPKFSKRVTICQEKNDCDCSKYHDIWYEYAKNTSYFEEIKNRYK